MSEEKTLQQKAAIDYQIARLQMNEDHYKKMEELLPCGPMSEEMLVKIIFGTILH